MYQIPAVVRRDIAIRFEIAHLPAKEQVDWLINYLKEQCPVPTFEVRRGLLLAGWIIAPDHHPGYYWEMREEMRQMVVDWCYRTAPLVRMRPNWDHFPSWEMEHPEVQSHEHNLVREIMANCHVIHDMGGVFEIPGPAPAIRA